MWEILREGSAADLRLGEGGGSWLHPSLRYAILQSKKERGLKVTSPHAKHPQSREQPDLSLNLSPKVLFLFWLCWGSRLALEPS